MGLLCRPAEQNLLREKPLELAIVTRRSRRSDLQSEQLKSEMERMIRWLPWRRASVIPGAIWLSERDTAAYRT